LEANDGDNGCTKHIELSVYVAIADCDSLGLGSILTMYLH
jgi:hypothetical protein